MANTWTLASKENLTSVEEEWLIFYWDRWLTPIADKLYWSEAQKYHKLPVSTFKQTWTGEDGEEVSADKVLVTITSEAFGHLIYANIRDRAIATFEYKEKEDRNAAIPAKGDAAKPFKAKYTDSKCGQVKFGGWSEEGYALFETYKQQIKDFRTKDKANNWATMRKVLQIVRKKKKITGDGTKKRKRKSRSNGDAPTPKKVAITIMDE